MKTLESLEALLATLFRAASSVLITYQLKAMIQAISDNQDADLMSKYDSVLTVEGSLAASVQLLCLFLCTQGVLEGRLHLVTAALSSCTEFCQIEAKIFVEDAPLKQTLKSISSLFSLTNGIVAYRLFRETRDMLGDFPILFELSI